MPGLAMIRQVEAVGFRSWPATSVHYDGTWAIRVTAAYPSRRLNSINPLDPADIRDIPMRVERAAQRLRAYARRPTFRQTPLMPPGLEDYLKAEGWEIVGETIVLGADLRKLNLDRALDQIPLRDIGRYADASLKIHERDASVRPGLSELLNGIKPLKGMFVVEEENSPLAVALCVQDGAMAGLFDLGTARTSRRRGHGRTIVASALKWARKQGAKTAWLQVEADNLAGRALYERFGFSELYRYAYWESPEA
ncbi:acetyltransferase (GNAT) family protein [Phyllobacterium leguminum]|uniref:Acetyltransferase (GNAT) family protein n=2 Tax=Phyllobacterium leguminum TaxID=314237 RepID=A0A318T449_9HYPH|nr:acetyltransferase (GNAT) family protein [Phyllobacterium leguminum]